MMFAIDKKKALCSSKHSIKDSDDETINDNNKEIETNNEIHIDEIHTINDWEHADLGDEQRKQKFLRLMGAKKRKDHNPLNTSDSHKIHHDEQFILEKKHCRTKIENESINRDLEKQFNEGLQSQILHTYHEGFGFHSNEHHSPSSTSDNSHRLHFVPATTETGSIKQ